jgi:hypothetical protein
MRAMECSQWLGNTIGNKALVDVRPHPLPCASVSLPLTRAMDGM